MKPPLESFLCAFVGRMIYEQNRGVVLGFGFTAQPSGEKHVAWFMLCANVAEGRLGSDVQTFAAVNGLAATRLAELDSGDGVVGFDITPEPFELPSGEEVASIFMGSPEVLPDPPQHAAPKKGGGREDWRDDDELTRAEAAARLGCSDRYLRTLTSQGKVRVRRLSRKTLRYAWGQLQEDWAKLGKPA